MNFSKLIALQLFCTLSITSASLSQAGGYSGGGGGEKTDEDNPWFLGGDPIPYCVDVAPNFPIPRAKVESVIKSAFKAWKKIYVKYGLYRTQLPGQFADGALRNLTVDTVQLAKCNDPGAQLRFKIGVVDAEMKAYFKVNSRQKIGLAHRKEYNHKTFRTGGIIWIAPDRFVSGPYGRPASHQFPIWKSGTGNEFQMLITHEIGHVLGIPHLSSTIMSPDIYSAIYSQHFKIDPPIVNFPLQIETEEVRLNVLKDTRPVVLKGTTRDKLGAFILRKLGYNLKRHPVERVEMSYFGNSGHATKVIIKVMTLSGQTETVTLRTSSLGGFPERLSLISPNYSSRYSILSFPYFHNRHGKLDSKIKIGNKTFAAQLDYPTWLKIFDPKPISWYEPKWTYYYLNK